MRLSPVGPGPMRRRSTISTFGIAWARARSGSTSFVGLAGARELLGLERRRRAAEHAHGAEHVRAEDRHVARVVANALFLLERRVVLLVDDDEAERVDRREERAASADRDVDLAAAKPRPHVEALARREPRVQHRDVVAEASAEARDELRRERDLRHEHDGAATELLRLGDGAQVDLGLARAGDAVEQERLCADLGRERRRERVHRDLLRVGGRELGVAQRSTP